MPLIQRLLFLSILLWYFDAIKECYAAVLASECNCDDNLYCCHFFIVILSAVHLCEKAD